MFTSETRMDKLLRIENLSLRLGYAGQIINALNGVNLTISRGEILGLVGSSGSGKTMTALSITKILPESACITGGAIKFNGQDLLSFSEEDLVPIRGREISYIFQEASASLNPVLTIGRSIQETVMLRENVTKKDAKLSALKLLDMVRLPEAENILLSYPHQLSGGMNQRVMIAMVLASSPKLLIADEPTTSLDVTVEREIIQMLLDLKKKLGFSILFITHNLSLVRRFADRVAIMSAGKIVEEGPTDSIFFAPRAQHTRDLINSII